MTIKMTTVPSKKLSQSITAAATSFKLNDIEGWDGVDLAASDFGTQAWAVFRNDANTAMEIMEIDPSTIASASITILYRGLKFDGTQTTEVSANKLVWVANETIVELGTTVPQLLDALAAQVGDETINGVKTFVSSPIVPTPGSATQAANKSYVDGVAIAGGADASTTVKGLSKMSTAPASATEPISVGDNDTRVPSQDENNALVGTSGTPSSSNKYVTNDDVHATGGASKIVRGGSDSKIANSWINYKYGGTGADGALAITTGTTTIDASGALVVVKNYTSISITGDAKLTISNKHANGTILILKSQGNVTITSSDVKCIDMSGMGGSGGAAASGAANGNVGSQGTGILDIANHYGDGGTTTTGAGGVILSYKSIYTQESYSYYMRKSVNLACGSGGGSGRSESGGTSGAGGAGGGVLIVECGGTLNFTGTVSVAGLVGGTGLTASGCAGGGGGGSGMCLITYNAQSAITGTISSVGGVGGIGYDGATGHRGGGGGGSYGGAGGTGGDAQTGGGGAGGAGAGGNGGAAGTGGTAGTTLNGLLIANTEFF
jgi:hypothetical protein